MADAEPGIFATMPRIREIVIRDATDLDVHLREEATPFIVRGLIADWPMVRAGLQSAKAARDYVQAHARDLPFAVSVAMPDSGG